MKNILLTVAIAFGISISAMSASAATSFEVEAFNRATEKGSSAIKTKNYERAFNYLDKASKLGNKESQYQLALLYMEGLGVKQDYIRAYIWLNVAVEVKEKNWQKVRDMLHNALSEDDRAALAPMINEYITKYGAEAQEISCSKRAARGSNRKFMQCTKFLTPGL